MRKSPVDQDGSGAEMSVSIRFLDDTQPLTIKYDKTTTGQQLFDRVSTHLQLLERGYFGLRYDADDGERYWLDALRTVHKQMKNVFVKVLNFRVRYYPANPSVLVEGITRYYLFLQLRRDLFRGRLLCMSADAIELAALVVQSEMGDYDEAECPTNYISEFQLLPRQQAKLQERIAERHKELRGLMPADAEARFLDRASVLETYGVDPFVVQCTTAVEKQRRRNEEAVPKALLQPTFIGVHHRGVVVYCAAKPTLVYRWSDLAAVNYDGKFVNLLLQGQSNFASLAATAAAVSASARSSTLDRNTVTFSDRSSNCIDDYLADSLPSKRTIHSYKCETAAASRAFWLIAVDQRAFFTLPRGADAQRVSSGTRVPLLNRHSKFRFSGRSERELLEESKRINRQPPSFIRTPSTRVARDVQAKRHSSLSNVSNVSKPAETVRTNANANVNVNTSTSTSTSNNTNGPLHAASQIASQTNSVYSNDTYVYGAYGRNPTVNDPRFSPLLSLNGLDLKRPNGPSSSPLFSSVINDVSVVDQVDKRDAPLVTMESNAQKSQLEPVGKPKSSVRRSKAKLSVCCGLVRLLVVVFFLLLVLLVLTFEDCLPSGQRFAQLHNELHSNAYVQELHERVYKPVRLWFVSQIDNYYRQ